MKTCSTISQLHKLLPDTSTPRVLVPTMGALHEGHRTLIRQARQVAGEDGTVLLSLFVNPTQFNNAGDLETYPRDLEADLQACQNEGVDVVFCPTPDAMYLGDHSVTVSETSLAKRLCGATRPGHFDGVCTVVLKLFNLCQATDAVFGKKDYQQLAIIRRMVRDLNVPTHVIGVETVREPDGLAMSSRNTRLSPAQRKDAPRIAQALNMAHHANHAGETCSHTLLALAETHITTSLEGAQIDYLELLDANTLQPVKTIDRPCILATAVFYGDVRLIDNIELGAIVSQ